MGYETKPVMPPQLSESVGACERNLHKLFAIGKIECVECLREWNAVAGGWQVMPGGRVYCQQCVNAEAHT